MPKTKVAVTIERALVELVDEYVAREQFRSRSHAFESALADKLERMTRRRLARECAKLDPAEERCLAEEGLAGTQDSWPEY